MPHITMAPELSPDLPDTTAMPEGTRVRLAASQSTPPECLRQLADDPAVTVRAALTMNPAVTSIAHTLAQDEDDRVRALLGRHLAALLPDIGRQKHCRLEDQAVSSLMSLVTDEVVRVRAAIADVVKDMPEAPHDLILHLVHDTAMSVAEPIIRLSPLLTEEDLLGLLAAAPSPETATAVARRPQLCSRVADTIAFGNNTAAITALLSNRSAAICEATLDSLITRAIHYTEWHEPLVFRPYLSATAARALAGIVTGHILAELAQRADLPPDLADELAHAVNQEPTTGWQATPPPGKGPTIEEAMALARDIAASGMLTEDALIEAARRGEARICAAMIAVAGGVAAVVVDRACTLRSAKGLVSLIWRAGFSMRCAAGQQSLLLRLPPELVLRGLEGDGFPLAVDEMRWQIEFLTRAGR